ncbi:MAG: hypothetical protein EOM02_09970, partial [Synergistales bacterium]|nr:hypothetical protein [Synergistales bacterium]
MMDPLEKLGKVGDLQRGFTSGTSAQAAAKGAAIMAVTGVSVEYVEVTLPNGESRKDGAGHQFGNRLAAGIFDSGASAFGLVDTVHNGLARQGLDEGAIGSAKDMQVHGGLVGAHVTAAGLVGGGARGHARDEHIGEAAPGQVAQRVRPGLNGLAQFPRTETSVHGLVP